MRTKLILIVNNNHANLVGNTNDTDGNTNIASSRLVADRKKIANQNKITWDYIVKQFINFEKISGMKIS